jgi:hypothetical protein
MGPSAAFGPQPSVAQASRLHPRTAGETPALRGSGEESAKVFQYLREKLLIGRIRGAGAFCIVPRGRKRAQARATIRFGRSDFFQKKFFLRNAESG